MAHLFANDTITSSPKRVSPYPRAWRYLPDYDITLGSAPKVATSSIRESLKDERQLIPVDYPNPVWIVREPVDRFRSLWKRKCRDRGKLGEEHEELVHGLSPEELMDFIESEEHWNTHWVSQSSLKGNISAKLIPLEELSDWWRTIFPMELPTSNASPGDIELSDVLIQRVLEYYQEDVLLYDKILRD